MLWERTRDGRAVTVPSLQLDGGILVMEFVVMCYNYLAPLLVLIVVYLFLYFSLLYYLLYSILLLKLPSLSDCMQVWPRICCCKFLSTLKYLEQLSYNLFCLVQGNYQIQQGVTPFILAWQVGKDLPGLNLEESRQMEWRDSLKSHAKTLGATHWGVAPHRGAD